MPYNNVATTGLPALRSGYSYLFQLAPTLDGVPWNITGATVTLLLVDPTGAGSALIATIANQAASYRWTATAPLGTWTRSWSVSLGGVVRISQPTPFLVSQ